MSEFVAPVDGLNPGQVFFDERKELYGRVFELLGAEPEAIATLESAVAASQPWIKGDYGYDDDLPRVLSDEQRHMARALCAETLGMGSAITLPEGEYDDLLVFGASQFGNVRRTEFTHQTIHDPRYTFGRIVMLGGQRSLYPREVDGFRRLLRSHTIQQLRPYDEWLSGVHNQFESRFSEGASEQTAEDYKIFDETTQIRVSMLARMGAMTLKDESVELSDTEQPVTRLEYEIDQTGMPLTILHSPPQERKNGPARHTTRSALEDYVTVLQPPEGARVGFVGAQPHITRMAMTVKQGLWRLRRPDIEVHGSGPELDDGTTLEIVASEIPKSLYEALQLKQRYATAR